LSEDEQRRLLQEETIVVEFEPLRAKRSLPKVLRTQAERRRAHRFLDAAAASGGIDERQRALIAELRAMLPAGSPEAAPARTRRNARAGSRGRRATRAASA
jgi:hypothetical protein